MPVTEFATESAFSKDSRLLFVKWLWPSLVLLTLKAFPRNNNDRVCGRFYDGICFYFKAVINYFFSNIWGLSYKWQWQSLVLKAFLVKLFRSLLWMVMTESVANSVTRSVFNLRLWRSLFLVKLQAFYYKWQ